MSVMSMSQVQKKRGLTHESPPTDAHVTRLSSLLRLPCTRGRVTAIREPPWCLSADHQVPTVHHPLPVWNQLLIVVQWFLRSEHRCGLTFCRPSHACHVQGRVPVPRVLAPPIWSQRIRMRTRRSLRVTSGTRVRVPWRQSTVLMAPASLPVGREWIGLILLKGSGFAAFARVVSPRLAKPSVAFQEIHRLSSVCRSRAQGFAGPLWLFFGGFCHDGIIRCLFLGWAGGLSAHVNC
mmetsp:Transcript_43343/g.114101  ORF Transcript_43343/g.114101 Transcript_43343/m.114101 type:complete len:236 (-) Transcript_43343:1614-2321(-)